MTTRLILLGAPGAGKGTQAEKLCKELHLNHISTGNILREAIAQGSELGLKAKSFMDLGELVPDQIIVDLIRELLGRLPAENGFILDGYPRTEAQAVALDELLQEIDRPITHVIEIQVPEEVVLDRIQKRAEAEGRSDDSQEVAKNRLNVYRAQTLPVKEHYSRSGRVTGVNGEGSVDEVYQRLLAVLR